MAAKNRALTAGEIELLREVFRDSLAYEKIRLRDGAGANPLARIAFLNSKNWAMTYLNTIHFNEGHFRDDFAASDDLRPLLVHEAAHVWQYSKLGLLPFAIRYGRNFIACNFKQARLYLYDKAPHFTDATLEGQAQMISHYYKLRKAPEGAKLGAKLAKTGFYGL